MIREEDRSKRGAAKNRLEIQLKTRFRKRVSSQVPSKIPKASGYRVSNPKFKKGKGTNSLIDKPSYGKCAKKNNGDCLKGTDNWFGSGKRGNKVRDCPNMIGQ